MSGLIVFNPHKRFSLSLHFSESLWIEIILLCHCYHHHHHHDNHTLSASSFIQYRHFTPGCILIGLSATICRWNFWPTSNERRSEQRGANKFSISAFQSQTCIANHHLPCSPWPDNFFISIFKNNSKCNLLNDLTP